MTRDHILREELDDGPHARLSGLQLFRDRKRAPVLLQPVVTQSLEDRFLVREVALHMRQQFIERVLDDGRPGPVAQCRPEKMLPFFVSVPCVYCLSSRNAAIGMSDKWEISVAQRLTAMPGP